MGGITLSILEVNELTKDYGSHKGIFDITFSMEEGDVFGYLGPNGAGKTTTIRCLMGFLNPNHGNCLIMGMDCRLEQENIQKNIGYLPGEIAFFDEMTGDNFLDLMASMRNLKHMVRRIKLVDRFQKDMIWPDQTILYILAYKIWNISYVYSCASGNAF